MKTDQTTLDRILQVKEKSGKKYLIEINLDQNENCNVHHDKKKIFNFFNHILNLRCEGKIFQLN